MRALLATNLRSTRGGTAARLAGAALTLALAGCGAALVDGTFPGALPVTSAAATAASSSSSTSSSTSTSSGIALQNSSGDAPALTAQPINVDADANVMVGSFVSILPQSAPTRCLDITHGVATLQNCAGAAAQSWQMTGGLLTTEGNRCLQGSASGLAVVACNPNDVGQVWSFASGLLSSQVGCLSLQNNNNTVGASVGMAPCFATDVQQQWRLANDANALTRGTLVGALDSNGCLDVVANAVDANAIVDVYPCNGTRAQQWLFDSGMLRIGDYCLQSSAPADANTPITLGKCGGGSQQWDYEAGELRLSGAIRCLTQPTTLSTYTRAEQVLLEVCNGATAQQWVLGANLAL